SLAARHARDPGEAPRKPRHGHEQPRRARRRAGAHRAAGAPGPRGERREPLARGALGPARLRVVDAQRDLALDGPARRPDDRPDLRRPGRRDAHHPAGAGRAFGRAGAGGDVAAPAASAAGPEAEVAKMAEGVRLPAWADEMRQIFKAGATSQFVLHGNVFDLVPAPDGKGGADFVGLGEFLTGSMFQPFDVVIRYDRGRGVRLEPPDPSRDGAYKGVEEVFRFLKGVDAFRGAPAGLDAVADKVEKLDLRD